MCHAAMWEFKRNPTVGKRHGVGRARGMGLGGCPVIKRCIENSKPALAPRNFPPIQMAPSLHLGLQDKLLGAAQALEKDRKVLPSHGAHGQTKLKNSISFICWMCRDSSPFVPTGHRSNAAFTPRISSRPWPTQATLSPWGTSGGTRWLRNS